jgi:hypothetical protein
VRLADARCSKQYDVLGPLDEHEAGLLLHLRATAGETEVVLLQRLDARQRRELRGRLALALLACAEVGLQQPLQEVGQARVGRRSCCVSAPQRYTPLADAAGSRATARGPRLADTLISTACS